MTIGLFYLGLLIVGLVYALLSAFFGWLADFGDADIHVDVSGHLDAGHAHPISGTVLATFITGFGGGGAVAHYYLGWSVLGGLALAVAAGIAVGAAAFGVLELVFQQTQAGAEFSLDSLVGREAEVIVGIPAGGTGEVAYVVKGQREACPARTVDGAAVPRGCLVVVEEVLGATLHVRRKS